MVDKRLWIYIWNENERMFFSIFCFEIDILEFGYRSVLFSFVVNVFWFFWCIKFSRFYWGFFVCVVIGKNSWKWLRFMVFISWEIRVGFLFVRGCRVVRLRYFCYGVGVREGYGGGVVVWTFLVCLDDL